MINVEDIVDLAKDNWIIRENNQKVKKLNSELIKGINLPDINRIILYTKNIKDQDDYDMTLLHELYHAVNPDVNETKTEEMAQHTFTYFPEVIKIAKEIL